MAKRIALLLLGACLLFTCTSCGDTAQSSSPTQQSEAASAPPQTTEYKYSDNLPDLDYEGKQFVVASFENPNFHYTTAMEEETGDVINDSIYKRTLSVEERLNIDIVQQLYKDGDNSVKKSVLAGDDAYDVAVIRCPEALSFWQEGLLHTMDDIPNIDLSQLTMLTSERKRHCRLSSRITEVCSSRRCWTLPSVCAPQMWILE